VGCGVWGVRCGVWGVRCEVWGVRCGVWGSKAELGFGEARKRLARTFLERSDPTQPNAGVNAVSGTTLRAMKGSSGAGSPSFRYLIHRNPPMPLRAAYRRVLGLIA
jgi:hypothetical protein